MNVLIVDDEPMTRALLRRVLLKEFGGSVVEATNGLEALSVAGSKPVDLDRHRPPDAGHGRD